MSVQKRIVFDNFSTLPPALDDTSAEVRKYSGIYLRVDHETAWFDWPAFKSSIDKYKGSDLTIHKYKSVTIAHSVSTVDLMVSKIVEFLAEALSVTVTAAYKQSLIKTITTTFTGLKEKSSHGFANFNKSNDGKNSSYEYRVQFAIPNLDRPDYFYSLITTIKLEADIEEQSAWWGLVGSSKKNFSSEIRALELAVKKGFKNPSISYW